jgi:hypothetical protein
MQLFLSFAQNAPSRVEPGPNVWPSLSDEERREAIAVLARLLAKTATPDPIVEPPPPQKERSNE